MKDLLKKLRRYEIQIRKAINSQMQGDFHSVFKGTGLEFDDVRPYQYGDDVRTIHWNVSAKGHGTFVKTYREEKEQTVFFILDVSASEDIGSPGTFSCSKKEKTPEGILGKEEMAKTIQEVLLAEEKVNRLRLSTDSSKKVFTAIRGKIFEKTGVSDSVF